jgi:hypothetical protein
VEEVYFRDRQTRETTLVTADSRVDNSKVDVTRDGRFLIFSRLRTLTAYDRLTGSFVDIANGSVPSAAVTAVAFVSSVALVPSDTNGVADIYVFGDPSPPGPPSNLTTSLNGSSLTLSWTAPQLGPATSYVVQAGSSSGLSNLANFNTGNTATTYSASGVAPGTYFIRVRGANTAGTGPASNETTLFVASPCAPSPPANLAASVSGSTVTLTWTAGSGATSYVLLVGSAAGQSNVLVSDLGSTATRVESTNVSSGTYFVRVQALNACGQSAASNEVIVTVR